MLLSARVHYVSNGLRSHERNPDMPTITYTVTCPHWCVGHDASIDDEGILVHDHMGPSFGAGAFGSGESRGESLIVKVTVTDHENTEYTDPAALRTLVAKLSEAADWLEAQR